MSTSKRTVNPQAVYEYQQEHDLLAKQRAELIKAAMEKLEHHERLALCFRLEGVSLEGLGKILGCSHAWAYKLYDRAISKIRDELKNGGVHELGDLK